MKKILPILIAVLFMAAQLQAQLEPTAGTWKTWFITSGKEYRLPPPPSYKMEIAQVVSLQQNLDSAGLQQILFWNTGAPGYRWLDMMFKLWTVDTGKNGALANMLLGAAIYDATIAAWDTKYAYNRPRPFFVDKQIKIYAVKPESPSYPCEHSVAAGVAVAIIAHFYPAMADSVNRIAQQLMASRIAAGVSFPSDTRAGFELGKKIAEKEIEYTKNFVTKKVWDGKMPEGPNVWKGKNPMFPLAGLNKTVVLESGSQFRPGPPPDFAKDMAEMKNFKRTLRSNSNAYNFANGFGNDVLDKKILEYNIHLNPPRAARMYAITAVALYDGFIACWDAKYAYWGIRPDQYDTSYHSLLPTPPFPGYPSGHAMLGSVMAELDSYFFPADRVYFEKRAKDGAESRFQGGIHFRTDNDVALELGRKVAAVVIQKVKTDGADDDLLLANKRKTNTKQ
jgi:membrane-associated phospholipid phosphatase